MEAELWRLRLQSGWPREQRGVWQRGIRIITFIDGP